MSAQDHTSGEQPPYLSKKVKINGQFVTLYSTNGLTWLSSPEELQDTMARLENTRVTLGDGKPAEGDEKSEKSDKSEKGEKGEKVAAAPPKLPGSQYRMKGPKPRPILRQGGKVVEGTPIEPVSASAMNMKGAADVSLPTVKFSPMEQGIRRGKIVAPLAERRPGKVREALAKAKKEALMKAKQEALAAKAAAAAAAKKAASTKASAVAQKKGAAPVASVQKSAKIAAPVSKASKVVKAATPVKKAAKVLPVAKKAVKAKKSVAKKPVAKPAKKAAVRGGAKKRSR